MDNFQGPYLEINKTNNQHVSNESFRNLRPEIRQELIDSCREVIKTNIPKKFARHIHHAIYDMSVLPVTDENGTTTAAVATGFSHPYNKVFPIFHDIIFDNIPVVLFYAEYINEEFIIKAVNKAFVESSGMTLNQLMDHNIKDVIRPESKELILSYYFKAIKEKRIMRWEEKAVLPAGIKYGEVTILPIYEDNQRCMGIIGTVHDITDRKLAEIQLEKNFSLLNAVVEGTTDAVFIKDLEGRYLMLNSSTARFHNKPREEIIGHSDYELTLHSVADTYSKNDQEVVRTNQAKTFQEEGVLGGKYQCFLSLKAPYKDSDGKTIGIIGLSRDITELKISQKALEKSEEEIKNYSIRIQNLYDLSLSFSKAQLDLDVICEIIAEKASLTFDGGAVLELLKDDGTLEIKSLYHCNNAIRERLIELRKKGFLNTGHADIEKLFLEGPPVLKSTDYVYEKLGITNFYILPLKTLGKPIGLLKILGSVKNYSQSDLTFLKTYTDRSALAIANARLFKKANDATQLREDFIQVASHELRTPLTPLKLQIQLLQKLLMNENLLTTPKGKELSKILKGADQQVIRLKNLIDDLIDVTKFSTDKVSLSFQETNLSELIIETVSEFRLSHEDHQIELLLPEHEILIGKVDRQRIKQAINKLLSNAIKFGLMNPILVSAHKEDIIIDIKVQDFGLGISLSDQERIFERFERGLSINSYGGLGMGLYLTRKIIEAHGGKISIESELNQGSTFTIKLPVIRN